MQAPRNWRMKTERYRLVVTETDQGDSSIVNRPQSLAKRSATEENDQTSEVVKVTAA